MFQNPRGLGVAVIVSVWVVVAADFALAAWEWAYLASAEDPGPLVAVLVDGVNAVSLVARPVAVVLVVAWLWQARSAAGHAPHRYAPKWVVWGWLPVVGLWVPRRVVADVWAVSAPAPDRARRAVVTWWWVLWLLYDLGTDAHFVLTLVVVDDLDALRAMVRSGAVFPVIAAGAAGCLTVVVRRISAWQAASTGATVSTASTVERVA
ncbi:DUF4328 domain-containing protein [Actinosynnema sp. NPDC023587]|uniref:DUF4328 domain-containing protein n=1 Tax=Actinosynnema sp. NPDC023587 TaxID=3154695 RepID=UPI0033D751E5